MRDIKNRTIIILAMIYLIILPFNFFMVHNKITGKVAGEISLSVLAPSAAEGGGPKKPEVKPPEPAPTPKRSQGVLFDIALDLKELEVILSQDMTAKITIIHFGVPGKVNVDLYYTITDLEGNIILTEKETRTIEAQLEF